MEIDLGIYADLITAQIAHDMMALRLNWRSNGDDDDETRRLPETTSSPLFFPKIAYETMSRDIIKEMQHDLEDLSVQLKKGLAAVLFRKFPPQYKPVVAPSPESPPRKRAHGMSRSSQRAYLFRKQQEEEQEEQQQSMWSTDIDEEAAHQFNRQSLEGTITPNSKLQRTRVKPLSNRGNGKRGGKLAQLLKKKK